MANRTYPEWRYVRWRREAEDEVRGIDPSAVAGGTCGEPLRARDSGDPGNPGNHGEPGGRCTKVAGWKTAHPGVGICYVHGGGSARENCKGAWKLAIVMSAREYGLSLAGELNVSPWDALLGQVRLLGAQVEYFRQKIVAVEAMEGPDGASLRPGGENHDLVVLLEARGERLAKTSKMAIDAGVAVRLVEQVETEAALMARALQLTLESLGLDEAQKVLARRLLATNLVALEGSLEEV